MEKLQLEQSDVTSSSFPCMNIARSLAASVVIGTQIIVVGGGTDSIEILDVDQRPLQWIRSNAVLPFSVFGHSCVDYEGKLILIGGYNANHGI